MSDKLRDADNADNDAPWDDADNDADMWGASATTTPTVDRPNMIPPAELAAALVEFAHKVGSPSCDFRAPEPNASIHEILWALARVVEQKDTKLLRAFHAPALAYLRAHPEEDFFYSQAGIATKSEFATALVARVTSLLALNPDRDVDDPDCQLHDLLLLAETVKDGARVFPQIAGLSEIDVEHAVWTEFGDKMLDRRADPKDIAERALRVVGVPQRETWNLFHAAERMKAYRARRREDEGSGDPPA